MSLLQPKGSKERIEDHRQKPALDGVLINDNDEAPRALRPLHDRIYIQRLRVAESAGGIIFPETFKQKKRFSAREKMNAIPDLFHAHVLALGPEVTLRDSDGRRLAQGDEIIVHTYGEGDKLYTGDSTGEAGRQIIGPDDIVCMVER